MNIYIASLDFDGTLRVDHMEQETIDLLKSLPEKIVPVMNTGRGIKILEEKIRHYFPQAVDIFLNKIKFFICNNGTDIYYHEDHEYKSLDDWSAYLDDQWDRKELLSRLIPMAEKLGFDMYPEDYNYKLLYYFLRKNFDEAEEAILEMRSSISDLPVNLVYAESSQKPPEGFRKFVCEIFPQKAGKGNALIFLKNFLERDHQNVNIVACFGDDRNDIQTVVDMPIEHEWWYGCLVGNSTDWILSRAYEVIDNIKGKIIIAPKEFPGPLGIKWIMQDLRWLE